MCQTGASGINRPCRNRWPPPDFPAHATSSVRLLGGGLVESAGEGRIQNLAAVPTVGGEGQE